MKLEDLKKPFLYGLPLLFVVWVVGCMIWGKGGIIENRRVSGELAVIEEEIQVLERELERTEVHLRYLRDNERYRAGFAREMGYRKPDEVIFKFVENP
jgi:cell division protein FtsB